MKRMKYKKFNNLHMVLLTDYNNTIHKMKIMLSKFCVIFGNFMTH